MAKKTKRAVGGALLGAAATALAVKGALTAPIATEAPTQIDHLKQSLDETGQSALSQTGSTLNRAEAVLAGAKITDTSSSTGQASRADAQPHPPAGGDSRAHPDRPYDQALNSAILTQAAQRHGVDPNLVLALSYWESGWNQSKVSTTGAVGLMQVEPATAQEAGPALLGRNVDINNPYDNADVGAAILRQDLDAFKTPARALAAYYQGPTSLRADGMLPDTQQYVQGILDLAARMSS